MKNLGILLTTMLIFVGCVQQNPQITPIKNLHKKITCRCDNLRSQHNIDRSGVDKIDDTRVQGHIDKTNPLKNLTCKVFFNFDSFKILPSAQACIDKNANSLLKNPQIITLQGNCDEVGNDKYNYRLGLKRANSVRKSLLLKGVKSELIKIVSFGKNNPTCKNSTSTCKAKNRRVDFVFSQK